ncbi:LysR family transcriptional regulator [Alicyclobacillus shizuokensis]|uniref:LysR family transcriptional regulator n=1 Tax=Alicyclobacillus shizuokensis TaxID=392014 RepID=UPI000833956D|nr:LysR family transcriptional regulator [Alicyclobacillus shizuokensis]MCL6625715.1 LysR family transcriptional regulator [Alicyclobacillus shizuokensis]
MELRHLRTFKILAEELSYTRTAERLSYAQSSVTTQIQTLEHEFGVQLIERIGKRIRLTEAGVRLLKYADDILRLTEEAYRAVPGNPEPRGTLTIGAVESLCTYRLAPVFMAFRARYPQVELVFRTSICADLRKQVAQGHLDLAFTLEECCRDDRLSFETLRSEPMLVLVCPHHRLAEKQGVEPHDLDGETILVTEPGCSYRTMWEQALSTAGSVNPKIEFASIEAIKQFTMAGLGVTLLPEMAVKAEMESGLLQPLTWNGPQFAVVTQMCWRRNKWLTPAQRAFMDLTKELLLDTYKSADESHETVLDR